MQIAVGAGWLGKNLEHFTSVRVSCSKGEGSSGGGQLLRTSSRFWRTVRLDAFLVPGLCFSWTLGSINFSCPERRVTGSERVQSAARSRWSWKQPWWGRRERADGARLGSVSSFADAWPSSSVSSSRRARPAAGRGTARAAAAAGTTSAWRAPGGGRCATATATARRPGTAARTTSTCARYLVSWILAGFLDKSCEDTETVGHTAPYCLCCLP